MYRELTIYNQKSPHTYECGVYRLISHYDASVMHAYTTHENPWVSAESAINQRMQASIHTTSRVTVYSRHVVQI